MEPQHDADAIQAFFDGWDLYRRVIEHDYMFHRAIHIELRAALQQYRSPRILDLGCGDAGSIAQTLEGVTLAGYTGVDLSPVALDAAATNLVGVGLKARLVESDYLAFLAESSAAEYDAIVAGYTVHHLRGDDPKRFFSLAKRRLTPGGLILIYDVFREESESREQNLSRNHMWRTKTWTALSEADLGAIRDHVFAADYPKSEAELTFHAEEAGLDRAPKLLFKAPTGIHRLYAWQ